MIVRQLPEHKRSIADCHLIEFPRISDPSGNLAFIEETRHVPFGIRRVFYVYDTAAGGRRRSHAHRTLEQVIVCLAGGLTVYLDDGGDTARQELKRPWVGLYIPPMIWLSTGDFAPGTVYMVLASDMYDESDYYRRYEDFLRAVRR
jgi:hypothetical protein